MTIRRAACSQVAPFLGRVICVLAQGRTLYEFAVSRHLNALSGRSGTLCVTLRQLLSYVGGSEAQSSQSSLPVSPEVA